MVDIRRNKMCNDKAIFMSVSAAAKVAEKFNQNVYECPICFCFHTTSKKDWKQEFVRIEKYENLKREFNRISAKYLELKQALTKEANNE